MNSKIDDHLRHKETEEKRILHCYGNICKLKLPELNDQYLNLTFVRTKNFPPFRVSIYPTDESKKRKTIIETVSVLNPACDNHKTLKYLW